MQVILLERVESLGQMGDTVTVKPGYARNFLIPRKKALRATQDNIAFFETQKKQLEADNLSKKKDAEKVAKTMDDLTVTLIRQASESGKLYGSVSARDIADVVTASGATVTRQQVTMNTALKMLGLFPIKITLHPEVSVEVTINIARSDEEAKKQLEHGGALIVDHNADKTAAVTTPDVEAVEAAAADVFESEEAAAKAVETLTTEEEEKVEPVPAPKTEAEATEDADTTEEATDTTEEATS